MNESKWAGWLGGYLSIKMSHTFLVSSPVLMKSSRWRIPPLLCSVSNLSVAFILPCDMWLANCQGSFYTVMSPAVLGIHCCIVLPSRKDCHPSKRLDTVGGTWCDPLFWTSYLASEEARLALLWQLSEQLIQEQTTQQTEGGRDFPWVLLSLLVVKVAGCSCVPQAEGIFWAVFTQFPSRTGRQLWQACPFLTQEEFWHLPVWLHLQQVIFHLSLMNAEPKPVLKMVTCTAQAA